jgi:hypothetical protein
MFALGMNLGLHSEELAINCLSYDSQLATEAP